LLAVRVIAGAGLRVLAERLNAAPPLLAGGARTLAERSKAWNL